MLEIIIGFFGKFLFWLFIFISVLAIISLIISMILWKLGIFNDSYCTKTDDEAQLDSIREYNTLCREREKKKAKKHKK